MANISGSAVLKEYLIENVGREIPLEELNTVCRNAGLNEWTRVIRNLRQEGYDIENAPKRWYKLRSLYVKPTGNKRGAISKKLRYMVFERDNYTCQACGRSPKKDGVILSPDHIVPVQWGGETTLDNLQALCRKCNEGKQAWVNGEDNEVMKLVSAQTNAKDRLKVYLENHPNEEIPVDRLAVVARTREWTRELRKLRAVEKMDIKYLPKSKKYNRSSDAYYYKSN